MGFISSSSDNSGFSSSCPTFASNSGVCYFTCNVSGVCMMVSQDTSPFFLFFFFSLLVILLSLPRHDACPLQIHVKDLLSLSQPHDAKQILAEMNAPWTLYSLIIVPNCDI